MHSSSIFPLNDILLNEILKNPKQLKTFKVIKTSKKSIEILCPFSQVNLMFLRLEFK